MVRVVWFFLQDGKVRAQLGELLMNESDVQYTDSLVSSVGLSTVLIFSSLKNSCNVLLCPFQFLSENAVILGLFTLALFVHLVRMAQHFGGTCVSITQL